MINLIPPEGLRNVKKEYALRVGATLGMLFGFTCMLIAAALIPTYVLIDAQSKTLEDATARFREQNEVLTSLDDEVRTAMLLTKVIALNYDEVTPTKIIETIQHATPPGVAFESFQLEQKGEIITSVQVRGVAKTRETLIALKTNLEKTGLFENVTIPIGDLARDSNLSFALSISIHNISV